MKLHIKEAMQSAKRTGACAYNFTKKTGGGAFVAFSEIPFTIYHFNRRLQFVELGRRFCF